MKQDYTPNEIRAIGVLIEKSITTPDHYPLSANAVMVACNQKSNRNPVLQLSERAVIDLLRQLIDAGVVMVDDRSGRVEKYQHRFCNTEFSDLQLDPGEQAVLCELMLRGPQTPGELRSRASRMHAFKKIEEVEAALKSLEEHAKGPLVAMLPREAGRRESRYTHLFSGGSSAAIGEAVRKVEIPASELETLQARLVELEAENAALRQRLAALGEAG